MAFMGQQITGKQTWIEIDGSNGVTFVPRDVDEVLFNLVSTDDPTEQDEENMLAGASDYYDGHVEGVGLIDGYGARMSASGYIDCTEWSVFDTKAEAQSYLDDTYGDDEDEDSANV